MTQIHGATVNERSSGTQKLTQEAEAGGQGTRLQAHLL